MSDERSTEETSELGDVASEAVSVDEEATDVQSDGLPLVPEPVASRDRRRACSSLPIAPLALTEIARLLDVTKRAVEKAVENLGEQCSEGERGLRLQRRNGSVQMVTAPAAAEAVQRFLGLEHAAPLTKAALQTLSIAAYRQPITRPELDAVRGVHSDGVLRTLIARDLVEPVGRRETVGLPIEYGTTYRFLEYFGLASLDDLPPIQLAGLPDAADEPAMETASESTPADHRDENSSAESATLGATDDGVLIEELGQPA